VLLIQELDIEEAISCQQFQKEILQQYFPKILKDVKAREFMDLTQGNLTFAKYEGRFNELACFAPCLVADEENRVRKFERGLNPRIHDRMVCLEIRNFVELVNKASLVEESLKRNAIATTESRKRVVPPLNQNQAGWREGPNCNNREVKFRGNRSMSADDTFCPKCNRHHQGQCCTKTNNCFRCGQSGHFVRNCPKAKIRDRSQQQGNGQKQFAQARVYALTPGEAETENEVVTGILPLFSGKAIVLFDSGASHSFVSTKYAKRFHISIEPMEVGVLVATLVGKAVICREIDLNYPICIEGRNLAANLIVFDMGFNIILGKDCLSNNHAIIDCRSKEIIFRLPTDIEFKFVGIKMSTSLQLISTMQVKQLILEGCQVYLACIKNHLIKKRR
jgi:hypothetical protein